jgi:membrane fusion protein, multidrug efflux system
MNRPFQISVLLVLTSLSLTLAGCSGGEPANAAAGEDGDRRIVRVETMMIEPTTFEDVFEITGAVEALDDATLSAQAAGTVVALVARGQAVSAGQVVARLDAGLSRASVQQAEAALRAAQAQAELAQDTYRRQQALYADSVISSLEFENVRAQRNQALAQRDQAEATLAQARQQLRHSEIVAPFAGIVEHRFVERGEQVNPGAPIARIVNTRRVRIAAGVPERYARDIAVGTPVQVDLAAYRGGTRSGTVVFAGSAIDARSRTFPIEVEIANPDGTLKPEMVAAIHVTRQLIEGALVVPHSAILRDEDGSTVYIVVNGAEQPSVERRTVTLGATYGGRTVLVSGVAAGEEIVIVGQQQLTRGDFVEVTHRHGGDPAPESAPILPTLP